MDLEHLGRSGASAVTARMHLYDALLTSLFGRTSKTTSSDRNFCGKFRAPEPLTIR